MRRGREPKSAAMSAAMPGVKVLALLSQGPTVCHYKVQMETPGGAAPRIGLMSYNLATGQGNIMMPSEYGEGEDSLKMMPGAGGGQNGPASAEQALSDCCDLYKELSTLASKEQWGRVVGKEEKIRATVARLGETRTNSSSIRVCECVRVCAYAHSRARTHTHTHTLSLSLSHTHTHTHLHGFRPAVTILRREGKEDSYHCFQINKRAIRMQTGTDHSVLTLQNFTSGISIHVHWCPCQIVLHR